MFDQPPSPTGVPYPSPRYVTDEEARQVFGENARYYIDMSGEEFLRTWRNREFGGVDHHPDHLKIMEVASLLALAAPLSCAAKGR